ncbi:hypothetical protein TorRG33x02_291180, partial [Trema orientale]
MSPLPNLCMNRRSPSPRSSPPPPPPPPPPDFLLTRWIASHRGSHDGACGFIEEKLDDVVRVVASEPELVLRFVSTAVVAVVVVELKLRLSKSSARSSAALGSIPATVGFECYGSS